MYTELINVGDALYACRSDLTARTGVTDECYFSCDVVGMRRMTVPEGAVGLRNAGSGVEDQDRGTAVPVVDVPAPLVARINPRHALAGHLRHAVRSWCERLPASKPELRDDVLLVAVELFANAVEATERPEDDIVVCVLCNRTRVAVEVNNVGRSFDPQDVPQPELHGIRGRGVAIAQAIGALMVRRNAGTTTVRVTIPLD